MASDYGARAAEFRRMNGSGAVSSAAGVSGALAMMMAPGRTSSGNLHLDPIPGLKHDTGLAVDWSSEEQAVLKDCLVKYANEPNVKKYIKIAALLRDKTVRDVALRCRWMTMKGIGKRRKPEEYYAGKRNKDKKEKFVDSSLKVNMHPVKPDNMATYSFMMHHLDQHSSFSYEVPVRDSATQHLLDENAQLLSQIMANLSTFKLQDNIDLFYHTRNNIMAILTSMNDMPGIMSQMPLLPVSLNENLITNILPGTSQSPIYGTPGGIHLKQEPRF